MSNVVAESMIGDQQRAALGEDPGSAQTRPIRLPTNAPKVAARILSKRSWCGQMYTTTAARKKNTMAIATIGDMPKLRQQACLVGVSFMSASSQLQSTDVRSPCVRVQSKRRIAERGAAR